MRCLILPDGGIRHLPLPFITWSMARVPRKRITRVFYAEVATLAVTVGL
ncbi:MAG: hypothetical protein ACR5LD_05965 [Symbiopectobacterium sp.]